jgi:hypothetical protein
VRNAFDGAVERSFVGSRGSTKTTDLAYELEGRVVQFRVGGSTVRLPEDFDVSTHDAIS